MIRTWPTHWVAWPYQTGDYPWAASLLQQAAQQQTDDPALLFDLANADYAVGRTPDAETAMRNALTRRNGQASANFTHAAEAKRFLDMLALAADPGQAWRRPYPSSRS